MLFFMNIEQKLIEVEKVKNALISMGIDINYMGIICPEHDRADAYTALLTLFLLVNEETKYGKIELPTTPSSLSRMNKFKEQYKHHHGDSLVSEALDKYSSDLGFRAQLYSLYKDYLLPAVKSASS